MSNLQKTFHESFPEDSQQELEKLSFQSCPIAFSRANRWVLPVILRDDHADTTTSKDTPLEN